MTHTPAPLVFLDTETTGLEPTDEVWEIAAVRRLIEDGREVARDEYQWFVHHDELKADRLPESFRADHDARYNPARAITPAEAATLLTDLVFAVPDGTPYRLRPHVVGAVPSFDMGHLERIVRAHGHTPGWHHHLIDAETLAVGYLRGRYSAFLDAELIAGKVPPFPPAPFDSDDLSRALRVDPDQFARHTAMGDVRWAIAMYDRVMGVRS